ncbi:response regulator receiver modulated metal dependent phosphohydrolase [Desulfobulbus propionicus DSM 2032]|jgi:putative two-component system response regulator|uniref:Response regulator receiver modulated metal dependent phosphohydrolase n=1 Tax=Desulfobulbus propionicus (strain ATCC 33891 / DSM 2032 / VKM B-1956 / 1pr3) TaxID=577650 RepID=A0A7U3YNJ2_DESPD|nr:HD domain-containing phosphohydrolase [Desulfobulbus propionicus]ADW18651.1 response regulator receiver modulated metal dependent phosphohydrolase [Desulfobulbus propionicus DSM 2032]
METPIVLVVDDEPTNLAVLANLLRPLYTVRACKSGEQALAAAIREPRPDLILLDVMMPGMDGFSVLHRLRQHEHSRDIPVIFVTALSDELDEEHGLRLGAVDYITKPIKPAVVLSRVQVHVEVKQARDRLKSHNAWLETEVARRMQENVLIQDVSLAAMAQLAETRDSDLGNHIARTRAYVETLARRLQPHPRFARDLDELNLTRIVKASPLHDIGKIGIPDRILLKPGPLTPAEWAIMQTHCRIGGNAIERAMNTTLRQYADRPDQAKPEALMFLEVAKDIAISHHERWDGSGYPDGLAGEAIPLAARLMALADVFDALTTERVYKKPWPVEAAVALVREQKNRHFDPDIVEAFEAELDTLVAIQHRLTDRCPGGLT